MEIIKVSGFHIISKGNTNVGIDDVSWQIRDDFYFDNQEELEVFRKDIKTMFENYCGDVIVETFDETQKRITAGEQEIYNQYPVRYLIKSKDYLFCYKQADSCASYSSDIGTAIHFKLPKGTPENGDIDDIVIKSTDIEFNKILFKEADELESKINNYEYKLMIAKKNLSLIRNELNYGKF